MGLGWINGNARTLFHHSPKSIPITLDSGIKTPLAELCQSVVPPCKLNPFLFNGHLQTLWTVIKSQDVPIYYKRKIFEAEDPAYPGSFAVDFAVEAFEESDGSLPPRTAYSVDKTLDGLDGSDDSTPMLIALHGLSGGSHELYLRHVLAPLISKEVGWKACVVNARGCAMSKVTSKILFNARATWDVRQIVKWLHQRFPNRPLFAAGFSLGANILVNYLGEEGPRCVLKAAVVCSNPWNLDVSAMALQRTWLGREVYSKTMADGLKRLIEIHKDQVSQNTRVSLERIRHTKYLYEFDREIQCPTWGYPTVGAYYRDASSVDPLLAVRVPLFALNAEDDPIAVKEAIPFDEFKQNPYTVLCTTSGGGHLAWFETNGGRWFQKPMTRFLMEMAKTVKSISKALDNELSIDTLGDLTAAPDVAIYNPVARKLTVNPRRYESASLMPEDIFKSEDSVDDV